MQLKVLIALVFATLAAAAPAEVIARTADDADKYHPPPRPPYHPPHHPPEPPHHPPYHPPEPPHHPPHHARDGFDGNVDA